MEAIKFTLKGKTAFFKKPDVNVNTYFTYNNIHKVALLGLLGAIIGLKGHIQQSREITYGNERIDYPEFYDKLKDLKVAIIPNANAGYFSKKIQIFNNSVGYASKQKGGNLIVREQWLENASWDIFLLGDETVKSDVFNKLKDYIINGKSVYMPCLGKNDHPAIIESCKVITVEPLGSKDIYRIDSLFKKSDVLLGKDTYDEEENIYYFQEVMPYKLKKTYNYYIFEELCFTNLWVKETKESNTIYKFNNKILYFL